MSLARALRTEQAIANSARVRGISGTCRPKGAASVCKSELSRAIVQGGIGGSALCLVQEIPLHREPPRPSERNLWIGSGKHSNPVALLQLIARAENPIGMAFATYAHRAGTQRSTEKPIGVAMSIACGSMPEVLAVLERCLETPIVPGELELWLKETRAAAEQAQTSLSQELNERHPDVLAEIEENCPELAPHLEQIRAGDRSSSEMLRCLQGRLLALALRFRNGEPDEQSGDGDLGAAIVAGLQFVIHARTQEVAIETWLTESLERDHGTVD